MLGSLLGIGCSSRSTIDWHSHSAPYTLRGMNLDGISGSRDTENDLHSGKDLWKGSAG